GSNVESPEWRIVGRQVRADKLKDPLGRIQIFEAILSQIEQADALWQRVASQLLSGAREQNLAAVSGVQQPGDAVERRAEVIPLLLLGGTRVHRHPHPQRTAA